MEHFGNTLYNQIENLQLSDTMIYGIKYYLNYC